MKKFLCAILAAMLVLCVTACGGEKTTTTKLEMDQSGVKIAFELVAEGDKVIEMTQTSTLDVSAFDEETIATLVDAADSYKESYEVYEGVSYSMEQVGTDIVETIKIDTTNMDVLQQLSDAGLVPLDADNADFISLEKTIANLESLGMTVVE